MPTNLYGPGDKFNSAVSHVIPALIKKCVDAKESGADHIDVWGTGAASREFLFVDDAAEGIALAAEHYDGAEPVNLGTDEERPIRELVPLIAESRRVRRRDPLGPDQARRPTPARSRHVPGRGRCSGSRATVAFEDGLRRTIDWYLANRDSRRGSGGH